MSKRQPKLYFEDILGSISKIEEYLKGRSYEKFVNDPMVLDAVVRNLEIIGEAAKNIPEEIKLTYLQIPWKRMAGMRDKMVHEYFGLNVEILWLTLTEDLPPLKKSVEEAPAFLKSEADKAE